MSDDEFVELLWENGQIVLHGQSSSRPKKHPFPAPFMPFDSRRSNEKAGGGCGGGGGGGGGDAVLPKMGQFSSTGPPLHDFSATEEAAALSTHDDGSVPWVHYPIIDDPLQAEYCSGLLSELPQGPAALASLPSNNVAIHSNNKTDASVRAAAANSNSMEHWNASRVAHSGGGLLDTRCRSRSSHLSEPSRHCQSSIPRARPGPPDFSSLGTARDPAVISKPVQPSSSSQSVMNFSLFTRPVALAKANLESTERPRSNNDRKASAASISNPVESTIVQTASGLKSFSMVPERAVSLPPKELGLSTSAPQQTLSPKQTPAVVPEKDVIRSKIGANLAGGSSSSIMPRSSQFAASASVERDEAGKAPEAVVATSSVCSGNGAGHASNSNDPQHKLKRKYQAEGSASQEEDLEDESGVLRRSPPRSTKRSRTAQVHNLSERRRRDRINEKMRALQELIPNCNKVDKASMLDEAIEYLKTLQLQVQMMSMGSGLCIPPVLLPPTMQHLQIPPMHFPQMGMGLGYGLGMLDVNSSTGCPMIPLPHMNGAQFPCPIIPGAQSMTLPGSNAMPMFGLPGQGIPSQAPRMPPFASLAGFPTRANLVPQISGSKSNLVQEQLPSLENQQQRSVNLEATREVNAGDSQTQTISQGGKQFFKLPSLAQTTSPLLRTSVNGAANSTCQNEAEPSKTTSTG